MDRWKEKVALVTGASSGIGAATVKELAKARIRTIGVARRIKRIQELRDKLPPEYKIYVVACKCDVTKEDQIKELFYFIKEKFGGADILINNAGILRFTDLVDPNSSETVREVVETNLMGVVNCTREAFNSMKARGIDGHIIMINSIAGHHVPYLPDNIPSINIYPATKYALTALTETYRQEFHRLKTKIKVTSISPGTVQTEILAQRDNETDGNVLDDNTKQGVPSGTSEYEDKICGVENKDNEHLRKESDTKKERTNQDHMVIEDKINEDDTGKNPTNDETTFPTLQPEDVTSAIMYALSTPPHVQVHDIILKPLGETF